MTCLITCTKRGDGSEACSQFTEEEEEDGAREFMDLSADGGGDGREGGAKY